MEKGHYPSRDSALIFKQKPGSLEALDDPTGGSSTARAIRVVGVGAIRVGQRVDDD
jgi:hypothetical protein